MKENKKNLNLGEQQDDDEILKVLNEVIEMKANSSVNDSSEEVAKSTAVKLGGTLIYPFHKYGSCLTEDSVRTLLDCATQYSLQSLHNSSSGSSYEVLDAFTQTSEISRSTDSSSTISIHTDGVGELIASSSEQSEKFIAGIHSESNKNITNQSPQDMIDILKKVVKEGNIKAQESVKEFYQPTPEEISNIRKGSMYFSKVGKSRPAFL